jgi:iron complex transport system substrate-binding protein
MHMNSLLPRGPRRIACLSTEATEVLYRLGAEERIVGISGYTVHPLRARREKAKVCTFSEGDLDRILSVQPDLVIGFSELQLPLLRECERAGRQVLWFDRCDLAGINDLVRELGRLVHAPGAARLLVTHVQSARGAVEQAARRLPWNPRVYFEEWDDPMTCAVRWVSELIAVAGGIDVFSQRARAAATASERIVAVDEVLSLQPQIVMGSYCGQRFVSDRARGRPGWDQLDANFVEIKSADILSAGPAAIERGLPRMLAVIAERIQVPLVSLGLPADWCRPADRQQLFVVPA